MENTAHCVFCRNEQHTRHRFAAAMYSKSAFTSVFPYIGVWHRFAVDFEAILRETAREVYGILDRAAPVWSPNRGRRFHAKEPERHGKAVVYILISLPNQISPYEKKHIRSNAPFFLTLLISSFQTLDLHLFGKEINIYQGQGCSLHIPWLRLPHSWRALISTRVPPRFSVFRNISSSISVSGRTRNPMPESI